METIDKLMYHAILLFVIGGLFGYFFETLQQLFKTGKIINTLTGKEEKTNTAKSNVLYYELNDDAWCAIRPSGTEPKIKFYIGVKGKNMEDADKKLSEIEKELLK